MVLTTTTLSLLSERSLAVVSCEGGGSDPAHASEARPATARSRRKAITLAAMSLVKEPQSGRTTRGSAAVVRFCLDEIGELSEKNETVLSHLSL